MNGGTLKCSMLRRHGTECLLSGPKLLYGTLVGWLIPCQNLSDSSLQLLQFNYTADTIVQHVHYHAE